MRAAFGVLFLITIPAFADPIAWSPPDKCPDGFTCGALSARLAGHDGDFRGAFVAAKRACDMDTFFCDDYWSLHVFAGPSRGGDPAKGLAMLEAMCKTDRNICTKLARTYEDPPKASGLARDAKKAEALYTAECDRGDDSLSCSALARIFLKDGNAVKARTMFERGCASSDVYAPGVCGNLAEALIQGSFGAKDVKGGLTYLDKSCPNHGYRCDLAFDVSFNGMPAEGVAPNLENAKRYAREGCERFFCEGIKKIESKDPAWAKTQYTELCARNIQSACREIGISRPQAQPTRR